MAWKPWSDASFNEATERAEIVIFVWNWERQLASAFAQYPYPVIRHGHSHKLSGICKIAVATAASAVAILLAVTNVSCFIKSIQWKWVEILEGIDPPIIVYVELRSFINLWIKTGFSPDNCVNTVPSLENGIGAIKVLVCCNASSREFAIIAEEGVIP